MKMSKYSDMEEMLRKNKGYLFSSEIEEANISRTYLGRFVKENKLEMVSKGIYVTEDTWVDQLYVLQHTNPKIIYSGETALYLNGLMDREYNKIYVSTPKGFNGARLRERGIAVHSEKAGIFGLGECENETNYGNFVKAYDRERSICDLVKQKKKNDIQVFQAAIKTFMNSRDKNLSKLISYADKLLVKEEVMKYIEVLV